MGKFGLEQVLRCYCNRMQSDWAQWCPSTEFAINNWHSSTIHCTPFFANYGFHPRLGFEWSSELPDTSSERILFDVQTANEFFTYMEEINSMIREEMAFAQNLHGEFTNKSRTPAPEFQVGDKVYLSTKNLSSTRPSKSFDWKKLGPLGISELIGSYVCRLDLPSTMKQHNVFHVNLLRLASENPFPIQAATDPITSTVQGFEEWKIHKILKHDWTPQQGWQYLVQWKDLSTSEATWELFDDLKSSIQLLRNYHRQHPQIPSPFPSRRAAA